MKSLPVTHKKSQFLRSKESRITKLNEVKNHLENLLHLQPNRHREVAEKTAIVDDKINNSMAEARDLSIRIAHGCENCTAE